MYRGFCVRSPFFKSWRSIALTVLIAASVSLVSAPASAQLSFGLSSGTSDEGDVCIGNTPNGNVGISGTGDCDSSFIEVNALYFGPPGPSASFGISNLSGLDGSLTLGGALNAGAGATFGGPTVFNSAPTFGGGFTVAASQTVNMGGNRVQNVAAPTADGDAANKKYVDDANTAQNTQISSNTARITFAEGINTNQTAQIAALQNQSANSQLAISGLQSDVKRLDERDDELAEGIAISLALEAPTLRSGQVFALRGGWGTFEGSNALGISAAGLLGTGMFGQSSSVVVDAGIGYATGGQTTAGRGGVTVGW